MVVTHRSDTQPSLAEAQEIVGGFVEMVYLRGGSQMLVNEDGRMLELEPNPDASLLAGQMIRGPALVLSDSARWD